MLNVFLPSEGRAVEFRNHSGKLFIALPMLTPLSVPHSKSAGYCSSPISLFAQLLLTAISMILLPSLTWSVMSTMKGGYLDFSGNDYLHRLFVINPGTSCSRITGGVMDTYLHSKALCFRCSMLKRLPIGITSICLFWPWIIPHMTFRFHYT